MDHPVADDDARILIPVGIPRNGQDAPAPLGHALYAFPNAPAVGILRQHGLQAAHVPHIDIRQIIHGVLPRAVLHPAEGKVQFGAGIAAFALLFLRGEPVPIGRHEIQRRRGRRGQSGSLRSRRRGGRHAGAFRGMGSRAGHHDPGALPFGGPGMMEPCKHQQGGPQQQQRGKGGKDAFPQDTPAFFFLIHMAAVYHNFRQKTTAAEKTPLCRSLSVFGEGD